MPTIGFLRSTPAAPFARIVSAFREGLAETGFVEGRNVAIEYRWADNHLDRLPELADELVRRHVAVIIGNSLAAEAARAATTSIPIVFITSDDPVVRGLVPSMSRPGGNVTGLTFFGGGQLGAKRLELLHELVPGVATVALLMDPGYGASAADLAEAETAARSIGLHVVVVKASSEPDIDGAFAAMRRAGAGAIMVSGSPFFTSKRAKLVTLAARNAVPAIYDVREYIEAGGLMSYGASLTGAYRQAGVYAGRILKGTRPGELPVLQPTQFELVINAKTARSLGIAIPKSVLLRADEVIQ